MPSQKPINLDKFAKLLAKDHWCPKQHQTCLKNRHTTSSCHDCLLDALSKMPKHELQANYNAYLQL